MKQRREKKHSAKDMDDKHLEAPEEVDRAIFDEDKLLSEHEVNR